MTLKLAQLKTWLTCEEAAIYLGALLDENVAVEDVFHLASEKKIRLSVYLPTPQAAKITERVAKKDAQKISVYLPRSQGNLSEEEWLRSLRLRWVLENQGSELEMEDFFLVMNYLGKRCPEHSASEDYDHCTLYTGIPIDENYVFEQQKPIIEARGYWDIEPTGSGSIELKNRYLKCIGASIGEQISWSGIILRAPNDESNWIALQKQSAKIPEEINQKLPKIQEVFGWSIPPRDSEKDNFYNIDQLPENSHLVVSSKELQRFISQLEEPANGDQSAPTDNDHQEYPPHLEALILAWRKNWKNADHTDRSACPKKENVKAWLMEQGLSAKNADAGATIIKPQWANDKGW